MLLSALFLLASDKQQQESKHLLNPHNRIALDTPATLHDNEQFERDEKKRPFQYNICTNAETQLSQSCSVAVSAAKTVQDQWVVAKRNDFAKLRTANLLSCRRLKRSITGIIKCGSGSTRLQRIGLVVRRLDAGENVSILVLGGSMTAGAGVEGKGRAWPQFLQVSWP